MSSTVDRITQGLRTIHGLIGQLELRADPSRDWAVSLAEVKRLRFVVEEEVLGQLDEAAEEVEPASLRELHAVTATLTGWSAGVIAASGDRATAGTLLQQAVQLATGELRARLHDAQTHLTFWIRLTEAHQLFGPDLAASEKLLRALLKEAPTPVLRESVSEMLARPRPLTSAPSLFTFNSFGTMLYGSRDAHPDGTYVTTRYLVAFFLPLLPLDSFRVRKHGNQYEFFARVPGTRPQSLYRRALGGALALALVGILGNSYLNSPDRLAGNQLAAARKDEREGRTELALKGYSTVFRDYDTTSAARDAAQAYVKLRLAEVETPVTEEGREKLQKLARLIGGLSQSAREAAGGEVVTALLKAAEPLAAHPESASAELALLASARPLADPARRAEIDRRDATTRRKMAAAIAPEWPMLAFEQLVQLSDEESLTAAGALLAELGDSPSLYVENAPEIARWIALERKRAGPTERVRAVEERRDTAARKLLGEGRDELLMAGATPQLEAALKAHPQDHGLVAAVAHARRNQGDVEGAIKLLQAQGSPGRLAADAQYALALALAESGRPADAEALLSRYLDRWLPRFRRVSTDSAQRASQLEDRLIAQANSGQLPMGITQKLNAAEGDDKKQQELFSEYVGAQLAADAELQSQREEYARLSRVVSASLTLGSLRLERANSLTGKEREDALAAAEKAYLGVQEEAEGSIPFHLGMGQVQHRLGKAKEGNQNLEAVLARNDPETTMSVASVYRELGLLQRARDIAEKVFHTATGNWRDSAAGLLSLMATNLEDEEKWLGKISVATPEVAAKRATLRGDIAAREGKTAAADKEYVAALAFYEKTASSNDSSANNAAIMHARRYSLSGDPAHLSKAVQAYDRATRLNPESAIILRNLGNELALRMELGVLDQFVQPRLLKLSEDEGQTLVASLLDGPLRPRVEKLLTEQGHLRRLLEGCRKQELVAPNHASPYWVEKEWAAVLDDEAALRSLQTRVERVSLDGTVREESFERWLTGADDELIRTSTRTRLQTLAPALASSHGPTRAAALVLSAAGRNRLSDVDADLTQARAAVAELKAAHQAWPELSAAAVLPVYLIDQAVLEAAAADPAWAKVRTDGWRKFNSAVLIHQAIATGAAPKEALLKTAAFAEAAATSSTLPPRQLGLTDWVIATLAADTATATRASGQLGLPVSVLAREVSARINPHPEQAAHDALYRLATARAEVAQDVP